MNSSVPFDFAPLLPAGLPPAAARWTGRVKFDFTGGNNDSDRLPLDELVAAAEAVLRREGRTLSTYRHGQRPAGFRPLREFLAGKLKADAGIACTADDILMTSGSAAGAGYRQRHAAGAWRHRDYRAGCYQGSINRLTGWMSRRSAFPLMATACAWICCRTRSTSSRAKACAPSTSIRFPPCKPHQHHHAGITSAGNAAAGGGAWRTHFRG